MATRKINQMIETVRAQNLKILKRKVFKEKTKKKEIKIYLN